MNFKWPLFAGLLLVMPSVLAADQPSKQNSNSAQAIAYRPPLRGAPLSRVGGGTRSLQAKDLEVEVLAPEHIGFSADPQPTLFWYASRAIDVPVEFTLNIPGVAEPVAELRLRGPFAPGFHRVDTKALGVTLNPGVDYEWFIAVVFDEAQRSSDVAAGAGIRYVVADAAVSGSLNGKSSVPAAAVFAEAGYWYDALTALEQPGDTEASAQRAELLRQVGLTQAAAAAP